MGLLCFLLDFLSLCFCDSSFLFMDNNDNFSEGFQVIHQKDRLIIKMT